MPDDPKSLAARVIAAAEKRTPGEWRTGHVEKDRIFVPWNGIGHERVLLRMNTNSVEFPFEADATFIVTACNAAEPIARALLDAEITAQARDAEIAGVRAACADLHAELATLRSESRGGGDLSPDDLATLAALATAIDAAEVSFHADPDAPPDDPPATTVDEIVGHLDERVELTPWATVAIAAVVPLLRELATLRSEVARLTAEREAAGEAEREACADLCKRYEERLPRTAGEYATDDAVAKAEAACELETMIRARGKGPTT